MRVYIWFLALAITFGFLGAYKSGSPEERYMAAVSDWRERWKTGEEKLCYWDYLPKGIETRNKAIFLSIFVAIGGALARRIRFRPLSFDDDVKVRPVPFLMCIGLTIYIYLTVYGHLY